MAGVLCEITEEWDVPLMVTRGYPSLSFLHIAALVIAAHHKPTHLYYFGDWIHPAKTSPAPWREAFANVRRTPKSTSGA